MDCLWYSDSLIERKRILPIFWCDGIITSFKGALDGNLTDWASASLCELVWEMTGDGTLSLLVGMLRMLWADGRCCVLQWKGSTV